ncbi:MAG: WD40 repeat domain-containing serine/threonine protein kinase, partial [Polyangia bacterium]
MERSVVTCRAAGDAAAFVAGDLTGADADSFRDHLRTCAACQKLVAAVPRSPEKGSAAPGPGARRHPAEVVTTAATLALKETLGSGGMGEVYRATDQQMSRDVALKVMTRAAASSPDDAPKDDALRRTVEYLPERDSSRIRRQELLEARFLREASITARLQHPSIVPVYQTGRLSTGEPFYTMKLITGRSLKELIIAAPTLAERLALVPNLLAAADAMAYAHSHGVIHRDLKPSNIMVGAFGETLVIDWGIAKLLTDDESVAASPSPMSPSDQITKTGAILGTPSFMAPEQARGEPIDERADVYALGGILQSLLTGRPPQSAPGAHLPRETSRELVAIVARAMAENPADRYPTAHELAEDLRRFLAGQLVRAHEYSTATILWRWMRRHRAPLTVAGFFLVALAALAVVSIRRVTRARRLAESERAVAVARRNELTLLQARSLLATDPTRALAWLKSYPPDGASWGDVQSIAADAEARGVARHLLPIDSADTAAFTPDGRRIVISGIGGWVHVVDVERGETVAKLPIEGADVGLVAVAPDGARVAIGKTNGEVSLWTIGGKADAVAHHGGLPKWISFARDGRLLVSADFNAVIATDLERHAVMRTLRVPRGAISIVQLSHDGRKIAWATSLGDVLVSSLADGVTTTWRGHRGPVNDLAFSDDDALLASAGQDGSLRVWRSDGKSAIVGAHKGGAKNVRFLPHAHKLLSFGADRAIATWDADRAQPLARLAGPLEMPHTFTVSDDGRLVATADLAGNVEVWDLETGESQRLLVDGEDIIALVFSPSHDWLFGGGSATHSRLWRMHLRRRKAFPDPEGEIAPHVLFAPGGATFATDAGNAVRLCDVAAGTCRVARGRHPELDGISYSPDGKQILSAGTDGTARLWDVATGDARVLARP